MCLAIPMKVKRIRDGSGIVEYRGVEREVSLLLLEDVREGDYILVHAGFAIGKIDEEAARETLDLIEDLFQEQSPYGTSGRRTGSGFDD